MGLRRAELELRPGGLAAQGPQARERDAHHDPASSDPHGHQECTSVHGRYQAGAALLLLHGPLLMWLEGVAAIAFPVEPSPLYEGLTVAELAVGHRRPGERPRKS